MTCLAMEPEGASAPAAGSLPVALSSLVGRQRELRELETVLGSTRLLTLTGTGGSGKTRLGLALAHACRPRFEHGAWWVDLASVTGRELLAGTVAAALGITEVPGQDMAAAVARHLRTRDALLVFDNCEQVISECAGLVERLLRACPGLTVVATSREGLRVPGELMFQVGGLGLPVSDDDDADAVELFTQRARAMSPGFSADLGTRAAIARLVRQLDGLPLAIELAAARAGILGVAEIASRLAADAIVLRHPNRSAPARHQTLQAALDWSYELLADQERTLFRRLACFSGPFTLPAAETVCAGRGLSPGDVADLLAALVAKSLVLVDGTGERYRYWMLRIIGQYAERALADSGEEPAVHAAHRAFYLRVADEARAGLGGAGQLGSLEVFEAEHDNLRAVLRRTLGAVAADPAVAGAAAQPASDDVAAGARLATLLWPFWYRRGYYQEARSWLERAATAALSTPVATSVRAAVLAGAGALAFLQCDYAVAAERLSKARTLYEEEGDLVGLAGTLQRLGSIAREEGRYSDARKLHSESLAILTELGDDAGVAASQDFLGFAAWLSGDPATTLKLSGQALAFFQAEGRRHEAASALLNLGVAASLSGDAERGAAWLQESLEIATQTGYREGTAWALHELALIIADDDLEAAADMLAESLEIHLSLGDRWRAASVVEAIAALVVSQPDPYLAATMLGAMAALRKAMRTPIPPAERPGYDRCVRGLRESLGASRFRSAWLRGEPMPLDEVADACLRAIEAARDTSGRAQVIAGLAQSYGLTEREVDVLRLLGQGLTNREIGNELQISTGTAGVHVSNILRKLGVPTRVQAATIACQFPPNP